MATNLRLEDRLDGVGNFVPWKEIIVLILQENELWDEVVKHTTSNPIKICSDDIAAPFNKKDIKEKRIILNVVKDHVIMHITSKTHAYLMWESLTNLYQSSNINQKMVLREKLKSIRMTKDESVTS